MGIENIQNPNSEDEDVQLHMLDDVIEDAEEAPINDEVNENSEEVQLPATEATEEGKTILRDLLLKFEEQIHVLEDLLYTHYAVQNPNDIEEVRLLMEAMEQDIEKYDDLISNLEYGELGYSCIVLYAEALKICVLHGEGVGAVSMIEQNENQN